MALTAITRETFPEVVKTGGIVFIEWWAPNCGACRQFDPVYLRVAGKHPDHVFAKINVVEEEHLAEFFDVSHTPALSVYRDGLLLFKRPGSFDEEALDGIVDQVAGLDMEQVRRDMEREESES